MTALPKTRPVRVVVVDDTADLRELLRFALEQHEFEVVAEAADGREGIARCEEHEPDLVLLDLAMPVMDGFEALPRVRRACPEAKIVVLSGFDAGAMSHRAQDLGADGYLQKGASLSATLRYVREVVGDAGGDTPPAPVLAVVPPPTESAPEPTAPTPTATDPALPAWVDALHFAVLRLDDSADLVVREANPAATHVLGTPVRLGAPLATTSPALAQVLAPHVGGDAVHLRLDDGTDAGGLELTLARDGCDLVLVALPG